MDDWSPPPRPVGAAPDTVHFQDFGLHPRILRATLEDLGFERCTPIQAKSLIPALAGRDVGGKAQTGTGKTAAFLMVVLQKLMSDSTLGNGVHPFALVVAPTRELVAQIDKDASLLGAYCGLRHMAVYGGLRNYDEQRRRIEEGLDLIVATPGRLLDYVKQRLLDLSHVSVFVIDEADRMLDMGFIPDIRRITARLGKATDRQTMLFSATLSDRILQLASKWLRDPVMVEGEPEQVVAEGVKEIVYAVSSREKLAVLLWILRNDSANRVLVFRNRRRDIDHLAHQLQHYGAECAVLSGDVPQERRMRVLENFRNGKIRVVVATDVAGRGLHVEGISHVVNYDLPYEAENYVHRIGRTGRAGEEGTAISFACEERSFVIPEIEEYIDRELRIEHPEPDMLTLPPRSDSGPAPRAPDPRKRGGPSRTNPRKGRSR